MLRRGLSPEQVAKLLLAISKSSEGMTVASINKFLAAQPVEDLGMVEISDSPQVALFEPKGTT